MQDLLNKIDRLLKEKKFFEVKNMPQTLRCCLTNCSVKCSVKRLNL